MRTALYGSLDVEYEFRTARIWTSSSSMRHLTWCLGALCGSVWPFGRLILEEMDVNRP